MTLASFFTTYFAEPLCSATNGYNIYNTLVYGLLAAVLAFGLYYLLKRLNVKIDGKLFLGAAPFVVLGSLWHVYADAVPQCLPYFQTPIIYIMFTLIAIAAMLIGLFIEKKTPLKPNYWQFMLITFGIAFVLSAFTFLKFVQPLAALKIFGLTALFGLIFYGLSKKWDKLFTPINICVLTTAMFDAASTAIGMSQYGYSEKHILPTFLINLVGSAWIMIPLKFVVVLFALWAIDKLEDDTQFKNIIKFAILVVTLGPGSRNTIRMLMGV
jgi:uncharacterized membrane protein